MTTVTIHQAKTQLSKLIARVEAGEEIVIARGTVPVARLTALSPARRPVFGSLKGKYPCPPDAFFFDPLPEDELKLWQGDNEILSDSHVFVWFVRGNPRCMPTARERIERRGTDSLVSAASIQ